MNRNGERRVWLDAQKRKEACKPKEKERTKLTKKALLEHKKIMTEKTCTTCVNSFNPRHFWWFYSSYK